MERRVDITSVAWTGAVWVALWALYMFFPGLTVWNFAALLVLTALFGVAPCFTPLGSRGAVAVMLTACLLVGAGVVLNAWYFTTASGGTPDAPVLLNTDSARWWSRAMNALDSGRGDATSSYYGWYGYVLALPLWLFGETVGTALLWSFSLLLTSLLLTGALAWRVTSSRKDSVVAMACCAAVCYWLTMGTLILKDSFVILAMVTAANGLTARRTRNFVLAVLAGAVMLTVSRPGFILMLVVGTAIVRARRGTLWSCAAVCAVCVALWSVPQLLKANTALMASLGGDESLGIGYDAPQQMAYFNIVGNFAELSVLKRLLLVPVSAAVQFFIPFPWNYGRDTVFGLTQAYAHVGYPWYLFGATLIYYFATSASRRLRGNRTCRGSRRAMLFRVALWGLICWLVPCYMFGGTISRYGLPMVALFAPAVAVTLRENYRKRPFLIYITIFAVLTGAALVAAHGLQTGAMQ